MRILLLDDNLRHRRAGARQLEALGHEVVALCDYGEARERAKTEPFDVALIDLLGIGKIAVAPDTNHHNHPMSAVVDWFRGAALSVDGAKVAIMHAPMRDDGAKDWGKILAQIIE